MAIIAEFQKLVFKQDLLCVFMEILAQYQIIEMHYDFMKSINLKIRYQNDDPLNGKVRIGLYSRIQILSLYFFTKQTYLDPIVVSIYVKLIGIKVFKQIYAGKYGVHFK